MNVLLTFCSFDDPIKNKYVNLWFYEIKHKIKLLKIKKRKFKVCKFKARLLIRLAHPNPWRQAMTRRLLPFYILWESPYPNIGSPYWAVLTQSSVFLKAYWSRFVCTRWPRPIRQTEAGFSRLWSPAYSLCSCDLQSLKTHKIA